MDYEQIWKILEALMVELTKKGVLVSPELVADLKSAKTLINIYKTEPTALDVATNIEQYLGTIEPNLLYLAEADVSPDYSNEWVKKLTAARLAEPDEQTVSPTTFVSGVGKGEHWIRMNASGLITGQKLDELLTRYNLRSATQEDSYLLIRGNEEDIKAFVKEVGKKVREKSS